MVVTGEYPLTPEEFSDIYSRVPRLTVELIVKSGEGLLMTLRSIEPYAGLWHIPGGTVYYGELVEQTVDRIAMRELNIKPINPKLIGIKIMQQMFYLFLLRTNLIYQ